MDNVFIRLGKEKLQELCNNSNSIRELLHKLNLSANGSGGYRTFYKSIKNMDIDLSVLKSKKYRWRGSAKKNNENFFTENSSISRGNIKKRIIKENLKEYKCSKCGNIGKWLDGVLVLQLEHKNGINDDNRLSNLEFLCPNCHSQTETFSGRSKINVHKKNEKVENREKKEKELKDIIKERKSFLDSIDALKFGWISIVQKEWKVSHTQVKRWIKKYYPEFIFFEKA